ncbi:MAG TPA: hypothetical protein VJQ09_00260, partial [Candidatus Limnocylindria bacterium]|nr:hypothetical protein [Candidatus Limnocylindria bacterium]
MSAGAVFRVTAVSPTDVDGAVCRLPWARLERTDAGTFFECADECADIAAALLARCGVRLDRSAFAPDRSVALIPAVVPDLRPRRLGGLVDEIAVRPIDAPDALSRLMRRSLFRRRARDVERIRAILRGDDRMFAWRRVIWATRTLLRARELNGVRPLVFDRGAVERGAERWSSAA